ncbi:hypothetical protein Lsai_2847 [Legionella sainthelensi]|uniref:Uncharacterized protein n=2 Tax=Legionella sainthelensi TaxID=28087 RepID=A0A0W0YEL2_9GAMM|nr:hypothetical protein Lsai_2847 [Legionella sainthelensi]VEH37296.1 Uncharacterised protein [Legionella sainthelensi]
MVSKHPIFQFIYDIIFRRVFLDVVTSIHFDGTRFNEKVSNLMTEKIIHLSFQETPQAYYDQNAAELGIVPDGTGLQIVFKINGENYVLAGPRGGSVLTVNGGTIENKNAPFLAQLVEEIEEETFGVLKITHSQETGYLLSVNGKQHVLTPQDDKSYLAYKPEKYAYLTFTAVCNTVTLEELEAAQMQMNPTAAFWNQIGNFLFPHTRNAPRDDIFLTYWESQSAARAGLIAKLIHTDENTLLIKPTVVFGTKTIAQALAKLNDIKSYSELMTLFKHTVGRYSERPGYYIFTTSELVRAVNNEDIIEVNDYKGNKVASGIFNDSAVKAILPSFTLSLISIGNSRDSLFASPNTVSLPSEQHTLQMQYS